MDAAAFDFSGYYLILLADFSSNRLDAVARIFRDCWSLHITNTNVLVLNDDESDAAIYTYFPFKPTRCDNIMPVLIEGYANRNHKMSNDYFVDKFRNFYGCPLFVATTIHPPYTMVLKNDSGRYELEGIEANLLNSLARLMNISLIEKSIPIKVDYIDSTKVAMNMVKKYDCINIIRANNVFSSAAAQWANQYNIRWKHHKSGSFGSGHCIVTAYDTKHISCLGSWYSVFIV